ncbi:sucrase ferredoxin [Actinokineospora fastidiosa]|uniref:sucrase ferredoxin n=1 Tax=Actinokineospora fastidiosa TaxID=1816 RepID=UPI001671805A
MTATCSAVSGAAGERPAGTAAVAATWLCVEQPGPWGAEALTASHLDPGLGAELAARAKGTGVRVVLIRRPGRHPDRHRPLPRRAYLAHTAPGRTFLRSATLNDPKQLLDLDFAAAGAGSVAGFGAPAAGRLLLVCTNGRRDVCCAVLGRPAAAELAAAHGDVVWEATHLGGHRFAPTALVLPTGYAYARVDREVGEALVTSPGVVLSNCRGRSTWAAPAQAAELAVRELTNTLDPDVLAVREPERVEGEWRVVVAHDDGRAWRVSVAEVPGAARPVSCGAAAKVVSEHVVTRID